MASFFKFHQFVENLAKGVHNLDADVLKVYLTAATLDAAADAVKADVADITAANGYSGPITVTVDCEQTTGTLTMAISSGDITITASGGSVGPFNAVVLYDDTPSSPADPLIGAWQYGSAVTLADGESITIDVGATLLSIA